MWFEKMAWAISWGIDSVEELERVEQEKAERAAAANRPSDSPSRLPDDFVSNWDALYPNVELDPSLLVEFGLVCGIGDTAGGAVSSLLDS